MAAFTPTKEASGIQTQFDAALEALSEISISTREEASSWVISFKCLWMSGNNNQEGMQAERAAMTNYAICEQTTRVHVCICKVVGCVSGFLGECPTLQLRVAKLPHLRLYLLCSFSYVFLSIWRIAEAPGPRCRQNKSVAKNQTSVDHQV